MHRLSSLNIISHFKEPRLRGEMADSRLRAGNIQDDSGTFCHAAKQESHQRPIMLCQKSSGDNLKKFPVAKYGSK